jgi:hypothetical protein
MAGTVNAVLVSPSYTRTYDAENRIRTQTVSGPGGDPYTTAFSQCTGGPVTTPAAYYPTTMGFSYWPDGHAANVNDSGDGSDGAGSAAGASSTWHWDGNDLLFTSQRYVPSTGPDSRSATVFAGKDAAFSTGTTTSTTVVAVYDRDWTGTVVSSHWVDGYGYGYGAWQGQGPAAKVICKSGHVAKLYPISSRGDGGVGAGLMPRSDGYVADVIMLQGVRSYDPNAGQWTTPDAYAGDVHDPMTQKPFMWNRNNGYVYNDPSGYDWSEATRSGPELLSRMAATPFVGALLAIGVAMSHPADGGGASAVNGGTTYKIFSAGLFHTAQAHFVGGAETAGKSVFAAGTTTADVTKMVQSAVTTGSVMHQGNNGTYKTFEVDMGHIIGKDAAGSDTSMLRTVFGSQDELVSAYPIPAPAPPSATK